MDRCRLQNILAVSLLGLAMSAPAFGQATRTWVSGVGDDANPCSRTAPCKTFAGAISKTAVGGEIDALDPGGFGSVTITKSITIAGVGTHASILSAGFFGVQINDGGSGTPGTAVVTLRNISINGIGTGTTGVNFVSGGKLNLENVEIAGTTQEGVRFAPSGNATLSIVNTTIHETAGGILVAPTGTAIADGSITNTVVGNSSSYGMKFADRTIIAVKNSVVTNSNGDGFDIHTTAGGVADVVVTQSVSQNNNGNGFVAQATAGGTSILNLTDSSSLQNVGDGTRSSGNSVIWMGSTRITRNGLVGIDPVAPGTMFSLGDNNNTFNFLNGAPTGTYARQ